LDAGDPPEYVDRLRVLESEALEDAADRLAHPHRRGLAGGAAELVDAAGHVAGLEERLRVRIYQRPEGGRAARELDQLVERVLFAPRAAAFVQQPQARDVPQEPRRACDAALVRQVDLERLVVD